MGQAYRDLQVWHKAMKLAAAVYEVSRAFPREELYGLTSQLRRSSISIPSNIAEGSGRNSTGEFKQFLGVARGSTYEVQTQLELAGNLNFASAENIAPSLGLSHEVGKMIYALIESL
ncbi:MAG TPA: four helix bundle protein [Terracidiphilus sp.]|jgi:four helix bundle protein